MGLMHACTADLEEKGLQRPHSLRMQLLFL
jgi:hypothetical protein